MSMSQSSTGAFNGGRRSPSVSYSQAPYSGGGDSLGSLQFQPTGSAFKKTFAVSSLKSLNRRQNYVLELEFEKNVLSFHKVRRGKEVKRSFPFHACVKLERGNGGGAGGSSGTSSMNVSMRDLSAATLSGTGSSTSKHSTHLVATFGHDPRYKKSLYFANTDERELFCNLVHAMIVSGSRAVTMFKSIQHKAASAAAAGEEAAAVAAAAAAAASTGGSSNPALANAAAAAAAAALLSGSDGTNDTNELVQSMDFCDFLISFSSAQTQLSTASSSNASSNASNNAFRRHLI